MVTLRGTFLSVLGCCLCWLTSSVAAAEPILLHSPPADAPRDKALELDFAVTATADMGSATVVWRPQHNSGWRKAPLELSSTGVWRATVPATAMDDPGIEYYVIATDRSGAELPQFAAAAAPHPVYVRGTAQQTLEEASLRERGGLRSDLRITGETVDYRVVGGVSGTAQDFGPRFTDFQVGYRYWVLKGVEYIEAGVGRLRGQAPDANVISPEVGINTGFDRGWAEVGFSPAQFVGLAGRVTLGGDEETFRVGMAAVLRLGMAQRSRLQLELGATSGVGFKFVSGFHVHTIPRVPLSLEVILTNEPNAGRETAERGRFRIGVELTPTVTTTAVVSYQALKGAEHGFGAGAEVKFGF